MILNEATPEGIEGQGVNLVQFRWMGVGVVEKRVRNGKMRRGGGRLVNRCWGLEWGPFLHRADAFWGSPPLVIAGEPVVGQFELTHYRGASGLGKTLWAAYAQGRRAIDGSPEFFGLYSIPATLRMSFCPAPHAFCEPGFRCSCSTTGNEASECDRIWCTPPG